ncbi:MAG: hypothetical protein U1E85_08610 [Rhodocyclaceae bacterium]
MTELMTPLPDDCKSAAAVLNRDCSCVSLDHAALEQALGGEAFYRHLRETRPHLFSDSVVFVGRRHLAQMAELVAAIEDVVALPAWQGRVLGWAPASARRACAARGVFLGYDFHVGEDGPKLIEINTNAGGGLLNARLASAQRACCDPVAALMSPSRGDFEGAFLAMFQEEWRLARAQAPLRRIAIVDEKPAEQYLSSRVRTLPAIVRSARHCGRDRRPVGVGTANACHAGQPAGSGRQPPHGFLAR